MRGRPRAVRTATELPESRWPVGLARARLALVGANARWAFEPAGVMAVLPTAHAGSNMHRMFALGKQKVAKKKTMYHQSTS